MKAAHPANIESAPEPKLAGTRASSFLVTIEAWMPSEIKAISALTDQLMRLIEESHSIVGGEFAVELALREALNNAVIHGNAMDPRKFVKVCCRCESGKGVWLAVGDQGKGFDPNAVADPLAPDSLKAEHGRGIHLMKWAMDQVVFEAGGTEVRMWKGLAREARAEDANQPGIGQPLKEALEREHAAESAAETLSGIAMSRRRFWLFSLVCVLSAATVLAALTTVISNRRSQETQNQLRRLENESRAAEAIVHKYGLSVCLLHVIVELRDKHSGQIIRIAADPTGKPLVDDKGMVSLQADGKGPPLQFNFFGTGFLVASDGRLLTNHHVAEPWWSDEDLKELLDRGADAFALSYTAYFPGISQGIAVKVDRISELADLATLKLQSPAPPEAALLELDARSEASVPGDPVILIGYPTGIEGILARAGSDVTRKVVENAHDVTEIVSQLAAQHLIRPTITQGHIGDVLKDKIIYDAATTMGGSGGPLFNHDGKVIGVNAAILRDFGGSNLAIPVRYTDGLLK